MFHLKANCFLLWNWAAENRSCPCPDCLPGDAAPASHVFWTCAAAQSHWQHLFLLWGHLGDFPDVDDHVWIFALELPECSSNAWEAARESLSPTEDNIENRAELFAAATELWRFMVATTIRTIWTERRRRMADPNAPTAQHLGASWTSLRRALTRFRSSAYQQGVVTGGGPG